MTIFNDLSTSLEVYKYIFGCQSKFKSCIENYGRPKMCESCWFVDQAPNLRTNNRYCSQPVCYPGWVISSTLQDTDKNVIFTLLQVLNLPSYILLVVFLCSCRVQHKLYWINKQVKQLSRLKLCDATQAGKLGVPPMLRSSASWLPTPHSFLYVST